MGLGHQPVIAVGMGGKQQGRFRHRLKAARDRMAQQTGMAMPANAPALTYEQCVALVESAEVVDLDAEPVFDTLARLGLEIVTNDAPR